MNINFNNNAGELYVSLEGRLDTSSAPDFEQFIKSNCSDATLLVLDCEKLEYISSAGLRVILAAHKLMKGSLKLKNLSELVEEVFNITGFSDILVIE